MSLFGAKASDNESKELERLRKENSELSAKNLALKSQIEIANNLSTELETICTKNVALEKEIRDVNGKYDEVARRLKISLEKNAELQSQLESLLIQNKSKSSKEIEEQQNRVDAFENKINELKKENSSLKQSLQAKEEQYKSCEESISHILELSSNYFSKNITSINTLEGFLSAPQVVQQVQPTIQVAQNDVFDDEKVSLCKMIKRLKKQNKQLNQTLLEMQHQYELEKQDSSSKYEISIKSLKNALNDQKNETSRQMSIVKDLDKKNNELLKQISDQKTQALINQKGINAQNEEEIRNLSSRVATLEAQLKTEKEQNQNNKKELNNAISKYKSTQSALGIAKDELQESNRTKIEMKFNFDHLQSKYDDLLERFHSYESSNVEKDKKLLESEEKLKRTESQFNQLKAENQKCNKQLDEQTEKMQQQMLQIQQLTANLDEAKTNYMTQKNLADKLQSKNSELSNELVKKKKEEKERQRKTEERNRAQSQYLFEQFPPTTWEIKEMPKDLESLVSDIVKNQTLRNAAKIKNVLTIVVQWFSKQLSDANEALKEEKNNTKSYDETLSVLAGALEIFMNTEIKVEDLKNPSKVAVIQERVRQTCISAKQDESERKQKETAILDLLTLLDVNSIQEAQSTVHAFIQHLQDSEDKIQALKKANKEVIMQSRERDEECKKQLDSLEKDALQIASRAEALEKEKKELENKIKDLEESIINIKEDHSHEMKTFNEMQNEQISECEKAVQRSNARTREEIQKRKEVEEQLNISRCEKEKVQKSLKLLHSSKRKQEEEIERLQAQIKTQLSVSQEKAKCLQESLQKKYEMIISQQKQQNLEIAGSLKEKDEKISQLEQQIEALNEANSQLQLDVQKIEMKSQAALEEQERTKKILECKMKTQIMSIESEYNLKLDNAERLVESERRAIIGRIGVEFCSLFNTSETIDESNFESFIHTLKEKFDSYANEDAKVRALLNIPRNQSLSSAVSLGLCNFSK